jgi:hypothetical protein
MLHGPCRIHYAYLDGKRVCNHQMKDCRTFLRLQSAMDSNQGARQGGKSTSQGYQVSWEFRDSSHGEPYWRGSTMVTMGPARDCAYRDTSVYPGSGPSWLEVNPYFLPASY